MFVLCAVNCLYMCMCVESDQCGSSRYCLSTSYTNLPKISVDSLSFYFLSGIIVGLPFSD